MSMREKFANLTGRIITAIGLADPPRVELNEMGKTLLAMERLVTKANTDKINHEDFVGRLNCEINEYLSMQFSANGNLAKIRKEYAQYILDARNEAEKQHKLRQASYEEQAGFLWEKLEDQRMAEATEG